MGRFSKRLFFAGGAMLLLVTGFTIPHEMKTRAQLIALLEREMQTNTAWLRVHAAEGLLDNGESDGIETLFRKEAETAKAPYRIAVWRVLARVSKDAEQNRYVEQIRSAMRDPSATDRISAAESLGKLNAANREDRPFILKWLTAADDATAAFPQWLLVLSSNPAERGHDEATLTKFLDSNDPVARLRAGFALGRLKELQPETIACIKKRLPVEPSDSIARIYLITALLLHTREAVGIYELEGELNRYISDGKDNEQLEAGIALGLRKQGGEALQLEPMLESRHADGRIGAANGMLRLLK